MNGAAPLLRVVDCSARQSISRIPHIGAHIRARRLGSCPEKRQCLPPRGSKQLLTPRRSRRSSSYGANVDELPVGSGSSRSTWFNTQEQVQELAKEQEFRAYHTENGGLAEELQYQPIAKGKPRVPNTHPFDEILDDGHPERVLFCLTDSDVGTVFIKTADNAAFSRAFCAIDPAYFVEPYIPLYRNLDPHLHTNMRYRQCRSLEERWNQLLVFFDKIIVIRRDAGHLLTLDIYRHLLKCAAAMGDETLAKDVFESLMADEEMEPDLQCYNSYLEARVWSGWFEAKYRNRTRVIQAFLDFRRHSIDSTRKLNRNWQAFLPQRTPVSTPERVREVALKIFQDLTKRGLSGNEETFTNLMLAMSRAGDLAGVKSILKSVWNVDVDLLVQFDEEEIESPTYYEEDSPLRPTGRLLSTILHVFATHNDISLAYTVLDYVSRNYNLNVPEDVWMQLYEMTFVLCCKRGWGPGSHRYASKYEYNLGQLDKETLSRFFDLITDEPHNVKPNVVMLIMMARIQRDQRMLDPCLDYLRRAITVLDEEKTRMSKLYDEMVALIKDSVVSRGTLDRHFFEKRREFILESMHVDKSLQYTLRMVYHLLQEHEWAGGGKRTELSHRRIPNFVKEFETFIPNELNYYTPTGHVRFKNGLVHREYAIQLADDHFHARVGRLRKLLDTDDYKKLIDNIRSIPDRLEKRENWCFWCRENGHHERDCTRTEKIQADSCTIEDQDVADASEDRVQEVPQIYEEEAHWTSGQLGV